MIIKQLCSPGGSPHVGSHNHDIITSHTISPILHHLQVTDLESETNVVSSSCNENRETMTSSFVTHCASSTISPIAETKTESSIEESKAGETSEEIEENKEIDESVAHDWG